MSDTTQNNGTPSIHADVYAAIDRSVFDDGKPVHLIYSEQACEFLKEECESYTYDRTEVADTPTLYVFLGQDADGNRWRVHLHR